MRRTFRFNQVVAAVCESNPESELADDDLSGDDNNDGSIVVDSNEDVQSESQLPSSSSSDSEDDQQPAVRRRRITVTPPAPQLIGRNGHVWLTIGRAPGQAVAANILRL